MACNCGKKSMNKWTLAQAKSKTGRASSQAQSQQTTSPTATTQPSATTGR